MKTVHKFFCASLATAGILPVIGQEKLPNVIIILADDIGYGDLSCNGEPTIHTPNVDALANRGVRFTNGHAIAATSTPSRYSLLTGHYAWRRNDTGIARGDAGMIIKPGQFTIGELFRKNNYTTAAVGKWHLGLGEKTGEQDWNKFISPGPYDIGFDYSYIMAATGDRTPCVYVENQMVVGLEADDPISVSYTTPFPGEPLGKTNPELLTVLKPSPNHGHDQAIINGVSRIGYMKGGKNALWEDQNIADSITLKAVQFIENNKDNPFFLYFATNDIHVPRVPHPRFREKSGMGARGDAILQFDWSVGEILNVLEKHGLTENTLIILTSDNGPVVDDGYQDQAVELLGEHRPWGDFRGGKYSSFEAGTRVPLIVSCPNMIKTPKVSNALVSHIDFLGSLASLLNYQLQEGEAIDTQDYLSAFLGEDEKGRDYVIKSAGTLSVLQQEWKYITPGNGRAYDPLTNIELGNSKEKQLYNLREDIGEKENKSSSYPEVIEKLENTLQKERKN